MHYPFHIALVLFMEGTSRFITWRNALEMVDYVTSEWTLAYDTYNYDPSLLADSYYNISTKLFPALEADVSKYNITPWLDLLRESTDPDDVYYYADEIWTIFVNATFKFFKISASKKAEKTAEISGDKDAYGALINALQVYDLVFVYFFLAAGLTLIIMAILMVLSKKRMVLGDWLGVALRAVMGIGIALIAVVSANTDRQTVFLYSPWMVPCVMLGLLVVVLAEGVLGWVLPAKREQEHGSVEMGRWYLWSSEVCAYLKGRRRWMGWNGVFAFTKIRLLIGQRDNYACAVSKLKTIPFSSIRKTCLVYSAHKCSLFQIWRRREGF